MSEILLNKKRKLIAKRYQFSRCMPKPNRLIQHPGTCFLIDLKFNQPELPSRIVWERKVYYRYMGRIFSPTRVKDLSSKQSVELCNVRLQYFSEITDKKRNEDTLNSILKLYRGNSYPRLIFDFGCGNGFFTNKIRHSFEESVVVGADLSQPAIGICKKKYPNLNWIKLSENRIDIKDRTCDLIISTFVMHFNIEKSLISELHRILKDDGEFIFNIFNVKYLHENLFAELRSQGFILSAPIKSLSNPKEIIYRATKK